MTPGELRAALAVALYTLGHPVRISTGLVAAIEEADLHIHPESHTDEAVVELFGKARERIASLTIQPNRTPEFIMRFPMPEGVNNAILALGGANMACAWDDVRKDLREVADGDWSLAKVSSEAAEAVLEMMDEMLR